MSPSKLETKLGLIQGIWPGTKEAGAKVSERKKYEKEAKNYYMIR